MDLHSKDLTEQKLKELQSIFPEIFEDGLINYDKFRTILGENVDEKSEHYSFNWSGKKECYQTKTETLQSGVYNFIKLYENEREFYFCFDKTIANDIVNAVPKDAKLICYEKALGDSVKLNLHSNLDLETL